MSSLKVGHIRAHLEKNFQGKIDLSDLSNRSVQEQQKSFLSRALAAYALNMCTPATIEESSRSVTDGFNDNGIDAIYFDPNSKILWLIQSKWIDNGTGGIDNGDIEKYTKGVKNLIDSKFDRFNDKVNLRKNEISDALEDASVKVQLGIVYTGKKLSSHNETSIKDLIEELNDGIDLTRLRDINIDKLHRSLVAGLDDAPINENIIISNWGNIEEPLKSYYGQINGAQLGELWSKYGQRLFADNIRGFFFSDVNNEIMKTIKNEPTHFIYFNNGITILCESIKKRLGTDRNYGSFECLSMSIVNGAQTLGSIGSWLDDPSVDLSKIKVFVKIISLEQTLEGFGNRITVATNTQNKIEKKDFVSINTEQEQLKLNLKLENINYHFKKSNEKIISNDNNFNLEEVAFSLTALLEDVTLTTMMKKESGRLWQDVTAKPYTDVFNSSVSAKKVIKTVRIYRFITNKMRSLSQGADGRTRSTYNYGNLFISHLIFQTIPKQYLADSSIEFDNFFESKLDNLVIEYLTVLKEVIEKYYPESMIGPLFRNYTKSRDLKSKMLLYLSNCK